MSTVTNGRKAVLGNICVAFLERAHDQPGRVALRAEGGRGEYYTYEQVARTMLQLAHSLAGPSLASTSRIGLLSENRPEWPLSYLGILAAGKTVVPIDANLKLPEIAHIVTDAGLDALFISPRFESAVADLLPDVRLFSFDRTSPRGWQSLLGTEGPVVAGAGNRTAALIYTSGTTGTPKVVILTHQNLLSNLEGVENALQFDNRDVFLSVLPLHHTYEATCGFLTPLVAGATVVYARSLKSKEILEDIALNQVTLVPGVPLLFEKMGHAIGRGVSQAPIHRRWLFHLLYAVSGIGWKLGCKWGRTLLRSVRHKAGLGTIRMLISGGAPLPPGIARFFNYLGIDFLQGYGMTECSPVISTNRPDNIQFGSVGPPLSNLSVCIESPDENGVGEICVQGDAVTPGYVNNPEATAELLRDGWLHTGDIGCLKDGHLWITGRRKNVIVSAAGKNIYPEELEEGLQESPYILESLVYGRKKDARQGEEVRAMIVPDLEQFRAEFSLQPESPDMERVRQVLGTVVSDLNRRVADFKRITSFDIQVQEFEKTSTKKIKRHLYGDLG